MRKATLIAITAALLASCESGTGPRPLPAPAAVQAVSGDGQTAPAGTLLPDPVVVRVTDEDGELLEGGVVVFRVIAGGGTVRDGTARTGADGTAGEHWTLGTTAGEQRLEARVLDVGGTPLVADTFTATARATAATEMSAAGGDAQGGQPGQPLAEPLSVRVRDAFGNPVAGWVVQWQVASGGGSVTPPTSPTGTDGVAQAVWSLGPFGGAGTVHATSQGVAAVTFTSSSPTVAANRVEAVSGGGQSAVVGTELGSPVVVEARDEEGRPRPGNLVVFRVISGGGSVREGAAQTGPDGRTADHWTLGVFAGTQQLEARLVDASGGTLAVDSIAATATPAAPSQIAITGGDGQTGLPGQPLPAWLGVRLRDPYGNVVPGWTVEWAVLAGGGTVQPATSVTDANGEARTQWVMGAGDGTVRASAQGVSPLAFRATPTPVPTSISALNGNAQGGPAGGVPQNPMVVRVLDAAGAPVAGAAVEWRVTAGGGTLRNPELVTDAGGMAITEWVLGPRVGPFHSLEARVSGVASAANFTATAWAPGTATIARVSGDAQTSRLGTSLILAQPLVAEVRVADGRPLQGAVVSWTASNGGSVAPASSTTDASGRASTSWTLGSVLGPQQLTSTIGSRSTTFSGTALTATRVELQRESIVVETGETDSVTVLVEGPGAGLDARWSVLDSTVAGVWGLGSQYRYTRVVGRKPGTTKLLVHAGDGVDTLVVTVHPLNEEFVSIEAAPESACALTASGRLYCWGAWITPTYAAPRDFPAPVRVAERYRFNWVSVGENGGETQTLCAGTTNRYAYCWNAHNYYSPPKLLSSGYLWTFVEVSRSHGCGITTEGGARCFGLNWTGQLGNGSMQNAQTPVAVSGGRQWMDVAPGASHSCGLTSTGAAYCWGAGVFLGRSPAVTSSVPVAVEGGHTFTQIDAGSGRTCALDTDGVPWCWGYPFYSLVPAAVPGMTFREIEVPEGIQFGRLCGVGTDGRAYCWDSHYGTVGPGSPVSTTLTFRKVAGLQASTCGITTGNKVYCWGANDHGELGQGDFAAHSGPVLVVGQP